MPRVVTQDATCVGGVVSIGALPILGAIILSEGVGPSSGLLLLDGADFYYIANTTADLKSTIEKAVSALNTIGSTLTAIGAGMAGPATAPPPTLATSVAQLTAKASELTALAAVLK